MAADDSASSPDDDALLALAVSRPRPGVVAVTAAGEVDNSTAPRLLGVLLDAAGEQAGHLLLDLRGVTFFGSAGVNAVLHVRRRAGSDGVAVHVVGLADNRSVARVFDVTGITALFIDHPTLDAALEELGGA